MKPRSFGLMVLTMLLIGCAASSPTPVPTPTEAPVDDSADWDLVLFSDSSGRGVAEIYAKHIEDDLNITVEAQNLAITSLRAGSLLTAIRGEGSPYPGTVDVPALVREAEVIVIYANPNASVSESHPWDWNCTSTQAPYANECGLETFDTYRAHLGAIYAEIFRLRGDSPVLIRAYDAYNPFYSVYREHGVYDACVACWENSNQAIHEAAAEYGVPVARVFDAFNGPNHAEDPSDKGYIRDDGIHPSVAGRRAIAAALRELGYEPTVPPAVSPAKP